jgi:hypothetical protein
MAVKLDKIKIQIDLDEVMYACERDDLTGFCTACGEEQSGFEPDARKGECDCCGEMAVYGAAELLLTFA